MRLQLTSDGFSAYVDAVWSAWADEVDYVQLINRRLKTPVRVGCLPHGFRMWHPRPSAAPLTRMVCTSYIERQTLAIRLGCRRFTRLANTFGKKLVNMKAALALHFAHHDLVRIDRSLQVTPAMATGAAHHVRDPRELL